MKTLILSGHPDLSTSVANKVILDELEKALPDAEIRKLDQLYPTAAIDVEAEKRRRSDLILQEIRDAGYTGKVVNGEDLDVFNA